LAASLEPDNSPERILPFPPALRGLEVGSEAGFRSGTLLILRWLDRNGWLGMFEYDIGLIPLLVDDVEGAEGICILVCD
jgi:hypothetical protein